MRINTEYNQIIHNELNERVQNCFISSETANKIFNNIYTSFSKQKFKGSITNDKIEYIRYYYLCG